MKEWAIIVAKTKNKSMGAPYGKLDRDMQVPLRANHKACYKNNKN